MRIERCIDTGCHLCETFIQCMEMGRRRTCGITLNEHKNTHLIFPLWGRKRGREQQILSPLIIEFTSLSRTDREYNPQLVQPSTFLSYDITSISKIVKVLECSLSARPIYGGGGGMLSARMRAINGSRTSKLDRAKLIGQTQV